MPIAKETGGGSPALVTSREPQGATAAPGDKGSAGDRALMDAVFIVLGAWLILFFLAYSLRAHNV